MGYSSSIGDRVCYQRHFMDLVLQKLSAFSKYKYQGWVRIAVHVVFWLLIFSYEAFQTSFTIKEANGLFFIVTAREVGTLILLHYSFAYYALPRWLQQGHWVRFLVFLLAAYIFMAMSMYYSLLIMRNQGLLPDYITQFARFYLEGGLLSTLVNPVKVFNTILLHSTLFITLLVKITQNYLGSREQKMKLQAEKMRLEKENIILELNFLKAQVNPHFFFNTLNNIYSLIEDKDELAANTVLRLSDLMRYSLYESNHDAIPLEQEVNFIKNYVELQRIRSKNNLSVKLNIDSKASNLKLPPLLLICFVENAFKHGVNNNIGSSWIDIRIGVVDNELSFFIQNSKPQKLSSEATQGGIGLINLSKRLELLYPNRYKLTIRNEPATYSVDLKILLYEETATLRYPGRRTLSPEPHREVH